MKFEISTTWDNKPVAHEPVCIKLTGHAAGCRLEVKAPFFGTPPSPSGPKGKSCPKLWDFEVVEVFFLNDKNQYLEVELCPHGQHLVLMLNGRRNVVQEQLALNFTSEILGKEWHGSAVVPASYLPPLVTRFNAFAIHGEDEQRVYEALYPATEPHDGPDFHRLDYFGTINLGDISSSLLAATPSELWIKHLDS